MKLNIYKPGQGKYTRIGTIIGIGLIVAVGAYKGSQQLQSLKGIFSTPAFVFGIPTAAAALIVLVVAWIVNRVSAADFLIGTEGEMKKVSWSSRREVSGSTKVVIVTTFILAGILFAVDLLLIVVFQWFGIMPGGSSGG